jgi:hypothetical protein
MVAAVSGLFCLEFGGKFRRWNLWRIFGGEFRRRFLPGFSAWVFGVGFLEWVFGRNTFRFEKSLSRIPVFIKLCKTPVSELSELAKAHQVRLCGLIKSSYFALQLFGLVGHIFSGRRPYDLFPRPKSGRETNSDTGLIRARAISREL